MSNNYINSNINTTPLNDQYPTPFVDNDSQGFRDNFSSIKQNLDVAKIEIEELLNRQVWGPTGSQGDVGPQGEIGPTGPQGVQGEKGEDGVIGVDGVTGPQGEIGPTGPQGVQGPTGPQGSQGNDGTSINIIGSLPSVIQLPPSGNKGDAYLILSDLWVWTGSTWENVGTIEGPQGPQGVQGIQGPTGPQGFEGIPGNPLTIVGRVDDASEIDMSTILPGDAYVIGPDLWFYSQEQQFNIINNFIGFNFLGDFASFNLVDFQNIGDAAFVDGQLGIFNGQTVVWIDLSGDPGPPGPTVYPSPGVAVSDGASWSQSLTAPQGDIVGTFGEQTLQQKTMDNVTLDGDIFVEEPLIFKLPFTGLEWSVPYLQASQNFPNYWTFSYNFNLERGLFITTQPELDNYLANETDLIYDLRNGDIYEHDGSQYQLSSDSVWDGIGSNKFAYNTNTNKLFFINAPGDIISISTSSQIAGNDGEVLFIANNQIDSSNSFHYDSVAQELTIDGSLSATSKSFVIDHPTNSNKKLRYGSLESPYHGVRLTGKATIVGNICRVDLPDYIHGLCKQDGAQIQITNIKHSKVLWVEDINVDQDYFEVGSDNDSLDTTPYDFYWSFTAIRRDIPDMEVEFDQ